MMVPRAFLFSTVTPPKATRKNDSSKDNNKHDSKVHSEQDPSGLQVPSVTSSETIIDEKATVHSNPVIIPPKRGPRMTPVQQGQHRPGSRTSRNSAKLRRSSSAVTLPTSVASILEATAIPVPRRNRTIRESRRLPRGNHVEDFSKLLMEGVGSKDDHLVDGTGNSALDILLSPLEEDDEDKLTIGNDDEPSETPFSLRTMSSDSMPSLEHDLESPSSLLLPPTPSSQRSPSERRYRQFALVEDCAFDHPLLETESTGLEPGLIPEEDLTLPDTISPKSPSPSRRFPRLGATFKSNLTASLRAIKSAAQTVSMFATPSVQPDDFLTRSLFTITPELTDDRRPLPMKEPPSPALRRYLNPITVSPAEMHIYHEYPHDPTGPPNKCPVSIQMQTYRRSGGRARRKGPKEVGQARDQTVSAFDPEVTPPITRQREPRENGDFLRMVVLEMNMRRSGKLRDDIPMRARIWLPPRKGGANPSGGDYSHEEENAIPARWAGVSVEYE